MFRLIGRAKLVSSLTSLTRSCSNIKDKEALGKTFSLDHGNTKLAEQTMSVDKLVSGGYKVHMNVINISGEAANLLTKAYDDLPVDDTGNKIGYLREKNLLNKVQKSNLFAANEKNVITLEMNFNKDYIIQKNNFKFLTRTLPEDKIEVYSYEYFDKNVKKADHGDLLTIMRIVDQLLNKERIRYDGYDDALIHGERVQEVFSILFNGFAHTELDNNLSNPYALYRFHKEIGKILEKEAEGNELIKPMNHKQMGLAKYHRNQFNYVRSTRPLNRTADLFNQIVLVHAAGKQPFPDELVTISDHLSRAGQKEVPPKDKEK